MKLKYTKTQLGIYLGWVLLHFLLWVIPGEFNFPNTWNDGFYPLGSYPEDIDDYDVREFLVYTIAPPVILFVWQLIQSDKVEKKQ